MCKIVEASKSQPIQLKFNDKIQNNTLLIDFKWHPVQKFTFIKIKFNLLSEILLPNYFKSDEF